MLSTFKKVLVFSAHPDDEIIGCGGSLKLLANWGAEINVVIATAGDSGISPCYFNKNNISDIRWNESQKTKEIIGIKELLSLGYKTQELTNNKKIFHQCITIIRKLKPDLVMIHSAKDKHRDHKTLANISMEAVWKAWENIMPDLGKRHKVRETWIYEIVDPLDRPDIVINIDQTIDTKLECLSYHVSQQEILEGIQHYLKGLAMVRGFSIGCLFGEAFKFCNIFPRMG